MKFPSFQRLDVRDSLMQLYYQHWEKELYEYYLCQGVQLIEPALSFELGHGSPPFELWEVESCAEWADRAAKLS